MCRRGRLCFGTASLELNPRVGEACRAKTKLFIFLGLNMASELKGGFHCESTTQGLGPLATISLLGLTGSHKIRCMFSKVYTYLEKKIKGQRSSHLLSCTAAIFIKIRRDVTSLLILVFVMFSYIF